MTTLPETMHALFDRIRRERGSVGALLRSFGISDATLAQVRIAAVDAVDHRTRPR